MELDDDRADEYARWFRCLADGTRIRILNLVAGADGPMTVGEIVETIGRSQSTVSEHVRVLAADQFVFTRRDGNRTFITVNHRCMTELPRAAAEIMGGEGPPW